jgi:hypothetical protein
MFLGEVFNSSNASYLLRGKDSFVCLCIISNNSLADKSSCLDLDMAEFVLPVVVGSPVSKVLIGGQAKGTAVNSNLEKLSFNEVILWEYPMKCADWQPSAPPMSLEILLASGTSRPIPWPNFVLSCISCANLYFSWALKPPWLLQPRQDISAVLRPVPWPSFRAFHDAIARWWDFSLLMLPPWFPSAWCYSGYRSGVLGIMSRITSFIFAVWLSLNHYDVHYCHINLMACMLLIRLSCFCNMRIPERQSVSYMVLALYIFRFHTNLQVIVPVLIVCITALYKLTGVCLLFSTWIVQQTNHLISLDELLGSCLFSFKEPVLNWVCGIWISVFCAQFDLFSWCSENSDLSSLRLSIALLTTQWCSQYISSLYCKRHVAGVKRETWPCSFCRSKCEETWNFQYCTGRKDKTLHHSITSAMEPGGSQLLHRLGGKSNVKEGRMLVLMR